MRINGFTPTTRTQVTHANRASAVADAPPADVFVRSEEQPAVAVMAPSRAKKLAGGAIEMATITVAAGLIGYHIGGPVLSGIGFAMGTLAGIGSGIKTTADKKDKAAGEPKRSLSVDLKFGERNVSIGIRPVAQGPNALAIGLAPLALGDNAKAIGVSPTAKGNAARAIGLFNTEVVGDKSKGIGFYLTTATGAEAKAYGPVANLAYGKDARAAGLVGNLAFGEKAEAKGFYFTYAHGDDSQAKGFATALTVGENSKAHGVAFIREIDLG